MAYIKYIPDLKADLMRTEKFWKEPGRLVVKSTERESRFQWLSPI